MSANDGGKVDQPDKCERCDGKQTLNMQHNLSSFINKQLVKMQEAPDRIPEGETPHGVTLYVYGSNVDLCRPGDRITITGTYRAVAMRLNPKNRTLHALYRTYIDVNHIQRDETAQLFSLANARGAAQVRHAHLHLLPPESGQ